MWCCSIRVEPAVLHQILSFATVNDGAAETRKALVEAVLASANRYRQTSVVLVRLAGQEPRHSESKQPALPRLQGCWMLSWSDHTCPLASCCASGI